MPPNTVSVARPSRFGNPFRVGRLVDAFGNDEDVRAITRVSAATAVALFRDWLVANSFGRSVAAAAREELRGKNLACFCPLDQPCHADVLLEVANVCNHRDWDWDNERRLHVCAECGKTETIHERGGPWKGLHG